MTTPRTTTPRATSRTAPLARARTVRGMLRPRVPCWTPAARWTPALLGVTALAGVGWLVWSSTRARAFLDLDGRRIALADAPDVGGCAAAPTGGRFVAPAHGLDVPLCGMSPTDGEIKPPTLVEAFLVRGYGAPDQPGTGLTVIAMHAVCDGRAPGNAFCELGAGHRQVTVRPGDPLVVDGVGYAVTHTEVLGRSAARYAIWGAAAHWTDELVVITSLQAAPGSAEENEHLVVFAQRAA